VGASGAERLAEALQQNSTLTSLNLEGNGVGASGHWLSKKVKPIIQHNVK